MKGRNYNTISQKMALPNGISSKQELLEAQAHVWNHIYSYINSMSLKCSIQLGIPDAIHKHGNPITLSQLADALNINKAKSHGLFRLMRLLEHSKFFEKVKVKVKVKGEEEEEEEEAYSLTPASRLLLRSEPLSVAPFALAMSDPVYTETWHHLSEWFRNDVVAAFDTKHGMTFPEYAVADDRLNVLFNEAMACDAGFVNSILTTECREIFDGLESMVDVGGGTGATAKGIAAAFPGMECTVLDLPNVVGGLKGSENLSFVSGDMFDFIPHADAIFMKFILHDWNDEECIRILKKCKEAISSSNNSGRKIILVEMVMEDEKETEKATETKLFFDMQMLAIITGKERSEKEWGKLFFDAGFTNYKITRVLGLRSLIEVFP